ncbi:MAG: hypothetical protein JW789_01070 [Candidatus Aenigmarchaeota archaeon]|nr:hypothetical protein [Candidatus Aenigmarchaeota archaeon]
MNGQIQIMEYMMLILMIMFITLFALVLIFGFQFITLGTSYSTELEGKSMFMLQKMLSTNLLTSPAFQKVSVFEDAKLTVMTCDDIRDIFGEDVYVEISAFHDIPSCEGLGGYELYECESTVEDVLDSEKTVCTSSNYPECSMWKYEENDGCKKLPRMVYRSVPVNIYRKFSSTVSMGVLTIGVIGGDSE